MINADDLSKEIQLEKYENIIKASDILLTEVSSVAEEVLIREEAEIEYSLRIENNKQEDIRNINLSKQIPEGLKFKEIYTLKYDEENEEWDKDNIGSYDESARIAKLSIGVLKPEEVVHVKIVVETEKLNQEEYNREVETITKITADNASDIYGSPMKNTISKPKLVTEYYTENKNKYITDGEVVEYSIKVTNVGDITANNVEISDRLPDELELIKAEYSIGEFKVSTGIDNNRRISATGNLRPSETMILIIKAKAVSKVQNITIESAPSISSQELGQSYEEPVTYIVEAVKTEDTISMTEPERKYEISGIAWYDSNKDGENGYDEKGLSEIEVMAINADTGDIIKNTKTDSQGQYVLSDLDKGDYLVIYKYDADKFSLSDYKKTGISEKVNSDVISVRIEENGNPLIAAISDTIRIDNSDFTDINMGVKDREIFDLKLDSGINKIVLQTNKETKEYKYEYTKFAKLDIVPEQVEGATAFVTYEIRVTNEGNVPGFVNSIIDYMPKDMQFKSELNANWYIGQDGKIYTNSFANTVINPGETKTLQLILVKQMTEQNTGINVNTLEIYESYNEYGLKDDDSIENNKSDSEDDYTQTTALLTIQLGGGCTYTAVALAILVIAFLGLYVAKNHNKIFIKKPKKKKIYK